MKIIADKRIPDEAIQKLENYGKLLLLETSGITYPAISGHPDIFFCQNAHDMVCAPNTPAELSDQIYKIKTGNREVGFKYPDTAYYNAVITDRNLIHHLEYTDPVILEQCGHLKHIHVNQAYTRCNLIDLGNDRFITSDKGIEKELLKNHLEALLVNPAGLLLPGFDHGFIGGCCGVSENRIFFIGSLDQFQEGEKLREFLKNYEIIELYDGPLFDGGSLIFLDN